MVEPIAFIILFVCLFACCGGMVLLKGWWVSDGKFIDLVMAVSLLMFGQGLLMTMVTSLVVHKLSY